MQEQLQSWCLLYLNPISIPVAKCTNQSNDGVRRPGKDEKETDGDGRFGDPDFRWGLIGRLVASQRFNVHLLRLIGRKVQSWDSPVNTVYDLSQDNVSLSPVPWDYARVWWRGWQSGRRNRSRARAEWRSRSRTLLPPNFGSRQLASGSRTSSLSGIPLE